MGRLLCWLGFHRWVPSLRQEFPRTYPSNEDDYCGRPKCWYRRCITTGGKYNSDVMYRRSR